MVFHRRRDSLGLRAGAVALGWLMALGGGTEIGRSQSVPSSNLELAKSAKPCFLDQSDLPNPPLSQTGLSIPNFWFAQERYGGKTLKHWFVEEKLTHLLPDIYLERFVTLVVDRLSWNQKSYLDQYVFVNHFASTARDYGYNLRVCSGSGELLGYYSCDFQTTPLSCDLQLKSGGFRLRDFKPFNSIPEG
ncbi:MAG: hypothetical protein ACP5D7_21785 [Limnospira sp.]